MPKHFIFLPKHPSAMCEGSPLSSLRTETDDYNYLYLSGVLCTKLLNLFRNGGEYCCPEYVEGKTKAWCGYNVSEII